jgi:thymidylate kinase
MHISFSGFEGCGKSTIIDSINKNKKFFISKESARFLIDMKKSFLEDKNDLSYTALLADLKVMEFSFDNNIKNIASDRNIIDGLTYLDLYDGQSIDFKKFNSYIEDFCVTHNKPFLYDMIVLIKHPKDDDHILNHILNDEDRIYGTNIEQYKNDSIKWEEKFLEIAAKFPKISKNIKVIQAYPDNKSIVRDVIKLINPKKPRP